MTKTCANSRTVKTALILPPDGNHYGTLFGGSLMSHIDDVASIAAVRHARKQVVTASTDSVDFLIPVKVGDAISVEGFVTSAHHTSMEIFVKVIREDLLTGEHRICATAFLTFVALGEDGKPVEVPLIQAESEIERMLFDGAELRRERRNERKKSSQNMAKLFSIENGA